MWYRLFFPLLALVKLFFQTPYYFRSPEHMCTAAVNHNPMEKARSLCKVSVQEGCRKPTWDGCAQRGGVWVPHGSRLLASEVPAHAMAAVSVNTRVGDGEWEMWVLVSPDSSRQRGTCVRKQRAAAGLWGGEPLQTVARGKTKFGLTEGKGKCGFAFTPAANLAIGSLFFFKTLDENTSA